MEDGTDNDNNYKTVKYFKNILENIESMLPKEKMKKWIESHPTNFKMPVPIGYLNSDLFHDKKTREFENKILYRYEDRSNFPITVYLDTSRNPVAWYNWLNFEGYILLNK